MAKRIHTYHAGMKVNLREAPYRFVSRARPEDLETAGFRIADRISVGSYLVYTKPESRAVDILRARELGAPAYPCYRVADTHQPFFHSDRLFVRFGAKMTGEERTAFAASYGATIAKTYAD